MTRSMYKAIWVSIFSLTYLFGSIQSSNATEVVGDNEIVAYIGTGGLLLPTTFTGSTSNKKAVADCLGCTWAYSVFCMNDVEGLCLHSTTTCSPGQIRYRVWFGKTKDELEVIGSVCWGIGSPPTRRNTETQVKDLVIKYVPQLRLTLAPPGGSLTAIPVIGWVEQPQTYTPPAFSLSGRKVSIMAKATWRWNWGDGTFEWKSVPGASFVAGSDPENQIQHQYRVPNDYLVEVSTFWSATYQVEGIGAFKVGGEVLTQSTQESIRISSARAVLVKN